MQVIVFLQFLSVKNISTTIQKFGVSIIFKKN